MKSITKLLFLLSFLTSYFFNQLPAMKAIVPQIIRAHDQAIEDSNDLEIIESPCKRFTFALDYENEKILVLCLTLNATSGQYINKKLCEFDINISAPEHINCSRFSYTSTFITVWNAAPDIQYLTDGNDPRLLILLFDSTNMSLTQVFSLSDSYFQNEEILGACVTYPALALKTSEREFELMFQLPNLLFAQ